MVWLSYDVLLAENFHNLIKLCQALSARFFSGVYFIPFMSPLFVSCSLWSLSYSPSSYRFSVSPPLFPPPSLILIDPLHPSLLNMCLFPSFVFKDVAWIRWWLGNIVLLSCICDSQSGNFDENNRDLTRQDQAMSSDASAYARLDRGYTSIKYALISKEVLQTFTWDITWKHCFFKTFADGIHYPCNTVEDKGA